MNREFDIVPSKTYATKENARKAVAKSGDADVRHFFMVTEDGRWFPVFTPTENEMATRGIHFRWNVVR